MEELLYSFGCIAALIVLPILFFSLRGVKRANQALTQRVDSLEASVAKLGLGMVTDAAQRTPSAEQAGQAQLENPEHAASTAPAKRQPDSPEPQPTHGESRAAANPSGLLKGISPSASTTEASHLEQTAHPGQTAAARSQPSRGTRLNNATADPADGGGWISRGMEYSVLAPLFGWFTKMHLMVQIGLLILFIGVAFLIKFVADQGVLSIELRLLMAAVIGVGLTAIGWRLRSRAGTYAMALMGGGLAIDYLTAYGALLYTSFPPSLAFPVFVAVGVVGAILAVLANAQILAFLAIVGAFLAPILASTGEGSHITLFSYYAVINVGILALAWFKTWRSLNVAGYLFTMVVGLYWGVTSYTPEHFASTEFFLVFFYLLYVLIAALFAARKANELTEQGSKRYRFSDAVDVTLVFGNPLVAFSVQAVLMQDVRYGMAISSFAAGLMYAGLAVLFVMRWRRFRAVAESFLFLAGLLIALSVPLTFEPQATSAIWAVMGLAWVWAGSVRERWWQTVWGVMIQLGAAMALVSSIDWMRLEELPAFVNGPYVGAVLIALSAYGSGYLMRRLAKSAVADNMAAKTARDNERLDEDAISEPASAREPLTAQATEMENVQRGFVWSSLFAGCMTLWAHAWWFASGVVQVSDFVSERGASPYLFAGVLAFVAISAGITEWIGARLRWSTVRLPILLLMPALLLAAVGQTGSADWPLANGGWYAWPIGLGIAIWALYRWDRFGRIPWFSFGEPAENSSTENSSTENSRERRTYGHHLLGLWTVVWLLTWIGNYGIGLWSDADGWSGLALIGIPTLIIWAILQRPKLLGERLAWPLGNRLSLYQKIGSGVMLGISFLLVFGWNTTGASTAPLPYLPLLNPADLVQIGFFVLAFAWIGRMLDGTKRVAYWVAGIGAFLAFNAGLARAVHHLLDVPFEPGLLADSSILQALYAVSWSLVALVLMFLSHRKGEGWRSVWIGGAIVLGLTVLKLFAIDLANSGTIARIVSFIGTGALIIVIAYFAPAPPRSDVPGNDVPESDGPEEPILPDVDDSSDDGHETHDAVVASA